MRSVAQMHNHMVDTVTRVVVLVGVVMVFVLVAKVAEIRFVVFVFVKYMVHVVPPKDISVGRLVVAVMRVIVAEMGLSLRVVEIMGIRVVCMMVLMVRMVMAKVESRMLALRWWLGSGVGLKDLLLSGKTTASPSSLSDRVRVRALKGERSTEKRVSPESEGRIGGTRMVDVHAKTGASSDFRAVDGLVSALNLFIENAIAACLRCCCQTLAAVMLPTR